MGGSIFVSSKLENGGVRLGLFDFSKMGGLVQTIQYIVVSIIWAIRNPPFPNGRLLLIKYEIYSQS